MGHPLAAGTQTIKIKLQEWNFGSLKSQKVFFTTNNYDVNYLQLLVLCVNICVYNKKNVNSECLFIRDIHEAILKMSATENDIDGYYNKCSSYLIDYWEKHSIGMNITKQIVLTQIHFFTKKLWS